MRLGSRRKIVRIGALARLMLLVAVTGLISLPAAAGPDMPVTCRIETDRAVLSAGGPQKVILKITLDAAPVETGKRPPVNLSVVLDRSGSMSGVKLEKAIEGAVQALRRLGPKDIFSLVIFDHEVETIVPAQSASNVESMESRIRGIRARGNTALFAGVSQGASEVRKHLGSKPVNRIILLSDGIANVGPSSPDDLGRLARALLKEDITVTTVGVGMGYNEDLMTRLAQNSDGNSYFVESGPDIPRIFSSELGDVLSVAAKKVRIIIECPKGVRPLRIIGREGRIKDESVELSMHQLYGGQKKFALVEVEVPEGTEGHVAEIASARVSYENPFTGVTDSASALAKATFSGNAVTVEKSANVAVQRDYQLNLNVLAQEQAVELSDQGKKQEAARELRAAAGRLRETGRNNNDADLIKKAEEMERMASQVEQEGMTSKDRKTLRTDSLQERQQQMHR